MSYQLPKRTYSELEAISSNLYLRAKKEMGLNLGQSLMYVEEETTLLRDESEPGNNAPLYVAIFKTGINLGLILDKNDPDFEFLIDELQNSISHFDIEKYSDSNRDRFLVDIDKVLSTIGL